MTVADNFYQQALGLASDPESNFLELGGALRNLLDRDPQSFKELIGASGLAARKAYYFVNISRAFDGLPVPKSRLRSLGWIKLQMLAGHIDADNADALLKMAETNTAAELRKLLKGERPAERTHHVSFCFSDGDFKMVADALAKFGGVVGRSGIKNKEEALVALIKAAQQNGGA